MKELDKKFYEKTLRPDRQHSYKIIVDYIIKNIKSDINSVIDYGCGAGWFLYYFKKAGIDNLVGYEPNKEMLSVLDTSIKDSVRFLGISKPIYLDYKFDVAMNIEVAEHIDARYADLIIENITRCTDLLIFSAAIPGQGGYGHINEQPFDYWVEKLNKVNFRCDFKNTDSFRQHLKKNKAKSWYINNISVFKRAT